MDPKYKRQLYRGERTTKSCAKCGKPMNIVVGQRVNYHKACRKEGRRLANKTVKTLAKIRALK